MSQADKDRVLAQVREQGPQYGMPQELNVQYPFADTKPPFDFALGRPNGEVWLQRPRAEENAPVTYDVFTRGGWQREVTFPQGASLAGFGKAGAIYGSIREGQGEDGGEVCTEVGSGLRGRRRARSHTERSEGASRGLFRREILRCLGMTVARQPPRRPVSPESAARRPAACSGPNGRSAAGRGAGLPRTTAA